MATLKDVAKRAGVSIATVSYCINNSHNLSPETRAKINKAIAELNYIPNSQARNLKRKASRDICAIFSNMEDRCFSEFLKGIIIQCETSNYSLNISCSYNDVATEQQLIKNAISKGVAGILLVTCQPENTKFFQDTIIKHDIPTVFLDRLPSRIDAIYFGFDNYSSIHYLTRRLVNSNFRDILLVCGPGKVFTDTESATAFQEVLEENGIDASDRVLTSDATKEGAFKVSLQSWINNPPQAIISTSQAICQGVIEACKISGLRIPEDICLLSLGVDNWNTSSFYPDIIRTSRPAYMLAMQGCQALINLIEGSEAPENRFHLLRDSILDYPLRLPMPRNLNLEKADLSIGTLNIACTELPTMQAIEAVSLDFYRKFHLRLHFNVMKFHDLFAAIQEDSHRTSPIYDVYLYDSSWFQYLLHTGCLKDLTEDVYALPEMRRYFVERNLENCSDGQKIYGFPVVGGTQFLLYRRDLFSDPDLCQAYKRDHHISLRPPVTWKEFNAIARFFTKEYNPDSPTAYGTAIATGLNEELALEFEPRLWSHGGSFFDNHGHFCMNTPANARAVTNLVEALQYSQPDLYSNQDVFAEFSKGNVAMIVSFTEYAARIQSQSHSEYLYKCGYAMIPGRTPVNVGWHFGVSPNCQKMPYVTRFFHWLHGRHNSYYMSILSGASALEYPYKNHELKKLYPWIDLTADAMEVCRSRIYPQKTQNGYLQPNQFEAAMCDELRKRPQTPAEVSRCLDDIQQNTLRMMIR